MCWKLVRVSQLNLISMELKPIEKLIEFNLDGTTIGSAFITINNGKVDTQALEDEFYATLRKNEKSLIAEAEEEQKVDIVGSLTPKQEDKLQEAHGKDYMGTDDDMPDAYESWLEDLSVEEIAKII